MTTITVNTSTTSAYSVTSGNSLVVASGGNVTAPSILSGGSLVVSGGVESGAIVSAGAIETVSKGSASGDQIYGVLSTVSASAATLLNEIVESGGTFYELNSATVTGTQVLKGGTFIINGNTSSVNTNTTLISGGLLELTSPKASISGSLVFSGGGNILETSATISGGYGDFAVISGFSSTDKIQVALVGSAGATLTFGSSSGNETVTLSGTTAGSAVSETFIFAGTTTYTSSTISLVADGAGVDIIYTSASAPVGSTTSVTTSTGSGVYSETSGNTLLVATGGSVSAASILSGGMLIVSGGADYAATVSSGGSETVSAGTATGDRVFGAATIVGGSVTGESVLSGGRLTVAAGAAETSATISAGGVETVLGAASGDAVYGVVSTVSATSATLANETVYSGGQVTVLNASMASATVVSSGGTLNINGAATATDTVLSGGGILQLQSPKATLAGGLTFAGGNNKLVVAAVVTTSAGSFGEQAVISGFSTTDVIDVSAVAPAGAALAFATSGGNEVVTLTGTSAGSAASENFIFAGTTSYTNYTLALQSDAAGGVDLVYNPNATALTISSGTTSGLNVGSGQTVTVLGGATVSSTTVASGGSLIISGTDSAASIAAGGTETVYGSASGDQVRGAVTVTGAGAATRGETVTSGGALAINGATNLSATISAGASEILTNSGHTSGDRVYGSVTAISAGALVAGETVLSGGALVINGGVDNAAVISAGGTESVINGGSASGDQIYGIASASGTGVVVAGASVQSGGLLTINTGAADSASVILAGGNETVIGSASGDQIYGTQLVSAATALVTSETVYSGGVVDVFLKGGIASATTVLSGGTLNISGAAFASNTVLSGGGTLNLQSPKADVTGSLVFAGGGNTLGITGTTSAGFGDFAINSGFSSTDKIDLAATAFVGSALSLSQTISGGNTVAQVLSAGAVVETFIFAGATLSGQLGLVSDGTGGVDLEMPPVSVTTSVTTPTVSGAYTETATNTLLVLNGGSVTAPTIASGAFLTIAGGSDTAATILAGGVETITAGSASGDQIFGATTVSGGTVTGETVLGGGVLNIGDGDSVANVTLGGSGTLDLTAATAAVTGSLVFTGGNNTLEAGAIAGSGFGDQAVISGFSTADRIDVAGIGLADANLSFATDSAGHEVATIGGAGVSESFIFADPAADNAGTMSLMSDGKGGVDLILDTTPVVTFTSLGGEANTATRIVNGTVDVAVDPEAIGTTVTLREGSTVVGTGTVGSNGHWSANVAFLDSHGANTLTASDTDGAGNTGVTSQTVTYDVNTAASAFTAGNLVVSISGNGDGSGTYGDNQASPITLEQITTTGSFVSQLVLPQTTTVVNGITEYTISGEYGSSSEGTLELSADGHSLVIAGYGVNALTFNAGGAAVYGTLALAQTTSIAGGAYTPVARVIADINASGNVDTSTALYNIYNLNNPRSVATVNGSSFYLGGQGVKGDATQGVWYAVDGASAGTRINGASDVRTAEIYNGRLYVSSDSTQGATNISDYGPLPTSATTPTVLTAISGSVILTSATANTVNTADIGASVNLSPESFFFANANTLYVADGGAPKQGGLGDGGLQKWVYNGTQWSLQYTLSAGLNLVANSSASGTSGLIGLTGKVVGDSVQLYATNETLTDLGQTYVYAITDSLSATSGAGESFTAVMTATAGENIRGIAFAPTAYAPTITGTVAGLTTTIEAPVTPFAGVTIADPNTQATETLTITVGGAGGTLSGAGLTGGTGGVYTLSGTAAAVTSELDALSFTPTAGAPTTITTTTFTLSDLSSANSTPTTDTTTTVIDTAAPAAPTLTSVVSQPLNGSTLEATGTGEVAGDTVKLYADGGGAVVGTGLVAADGSFDITTTVSFADGSHTLTATETDAANLTSTASAGLAVVVDTTSPTLTPVGNQTLEATGPSGAVAIFAATATDLIDGSDAVTFKEGNNTVQSGAIFALGAHTITASASDAHGNVATENFTITVVDTTSPTLTSVGNQTLEATGPSGAVATFAATATDLVDGSDAVTFKEGNNTVQSGVIFAIGAHTITASATDTHGNIATESFTITVQATPPSAPAITAVVGQPVAGSTVSVTGTGEAGDTVNLYADGGTAAVGTGTVASNGTFTITTTATFADGNHSLTATQTDAAAVTSTASPGFAVAVDPTAPAIASAIGQASHGGTIEAKGTGIAGETIALYVDGGATLAGTGTVAGDGSFDITTLAAYAAGSHGVTATQSDAAGLGSAAAATTASVFRLATASVGSLVSNLIVHVGDIVSRALTITNSAAGDGYSENLKVAVTGTTGAVTATPPASEIAGAASSTATIAISTAASGQVSGTATLGFASDGTGLDGSGPVSVGSTTVSLAATVDNYAQAAIEKVSGVGTLSGNAASGYTLDLGSVAQGTAAVSAGLGVLNAASGLADLLSGNFTIANGASVFTNNNFANFSGLAAGQADSVPFVTFSTKNVGSFSETITLHATGSNAGGYSGALANETITVTGTVTASDILTTHADSIVGGPANATIVAATKTLSSGDVITPTAGTDTLDLVGGGSFDLTKPTSLANITTLNAQEGASTAEQTIKLRAGLDLTVNVASSTMAGAGIKIIGALNNDTIHLGTGADSVTLAGGNNLVTVGSAAQSVTTGTGNVTVQAAAANAGVLVKGGTGHDVLEITTGGTATLNAKSSHVTVQLDQATTLIMNNAKTVSVLGSTGADTITAGGSGQTLTGNGGGDTLIGAAAGHDTFKDTLAHFAGATIGGFTAKTDKIDVSDFAASAITFGFSENAAGTIGTLTMTAGGHTASVQLLGQYMASGFVTASDGGAGTAITYNPSAHGTILAAAH